MGGLPTLTTEEFDEREAQAEADKALQQEAQLAAAQAGAGQDPNAKDAPPKDKPPMQKYSPDQPRDEQGQWSDVGGSPGGDASGGFGIRQSQFPNSLWEVHNLEGRTMRRFKTDADLQTWTQGHPYEPDVTRMGVFVPRRRKATKAKSVTITAPAGAQPPQE
jgi:hypothetical protein